MWAPARSRSVWGALSPAGSGPQRGVTSLDPRNPAAGHSSPRFVSPSVLRSRLGRILSRIRLLVRKAWILTKRFYIQNHTEPAINPPWTGFVDVSLFS